MTTRRTKLGMKVEGKRKPGHYEILGEQVLKGEAAQQKLEKQGTRRLVRTGFEEEIVRSQARIPRVKPAASGRRRGTKA